MVAENEDIQEEKTEESSEANTEESTEAKSEELEDQMAETLVSEGLGDTAEDDLEAQMAAAMAAESLGSDEEDDLEAQMAAAMAGEIAEGESDEEGDDLEAQIAAAMGGADGEDDDLLSALSDETEEEATPVKPVNFQGLTPTDEKGEKANIERLLDIGLSLSVELGRKDMKIQDILNLGPGKIIELDKLAGEPVDLLVNGRLLAKGEVVVVDENFGVRITELIDPVDRIKML